jgi:intracellular sulfur oxidation DsrE/DsrF family protein
VSYLNNLYSANPFEASIVLLLHGDEIPFLAIASYERHREQMRRAQSLTVAGPVELGMCAVAAGGHVPEAADVHGFVELVPMAGAEIVHHHQEAGYACMR